MVNDNGIITTLNPDTGAVIKQGRLTGALGPHFASPVAADGHIFFTTEAGAVVVVAPAATSCRSPSTSWAKTPMQPRPSPMAASTSARLPHCTPSNQVRLTHCQTCQDCQNCQD